VIASPGPFSRRINHLAHLGHLGGGKAADLRVLLDDRFVLGEIDAKGLVVASRSWSRSSVPTWGMSLSMMNFRNMTDTPAF
jgi:hypothetical protein